MAPFDHSAVLSQVLVEIRATVLEYPAYVGVAGAEGSIAMEVESDA